MRKQEINVVNTHGQHFYFDAQVVAVNEFGQLCIYENEAHHGRDEPVAVFKNWDSWRFIQPPQ